jgi:AraC family transcriptional regulator
MRDRNIEADIQSRWRAPTPTLVSAPTKTSLITLSRIRCEADSHERTRPLPPDDAYVVHVPLQPLTGAQLWLNGRETAVGPTPAGGVFLFHYQSNPSAAFHAPFDLLRFALSRATLDELAEVNGLRQPLGLRTARGAVDPLLHHLAASAAPLFQGGATGSRLILDHIGLAFHAHLVTAYNGAAHSPRRAQGGLAPWQAQRAKDLMQANIAADVSLADLAAECGLSVSHFARAFRVTAGRPAHRWLLECRVDAAKVQLLEGRASLEDIARACGFADASHLSRTFSRVTGDPPGSWRRRHAR